MFENNDSSPSTPVLTRLYQNVEGAVSKQVSNFNDWSVQKKKRNFKEMKQKERLERKRLVARLDEFLAQTKVNIEQYRERGIEINSGIYSEHLRGFIDLLYPESRITRMIAKITGEKPVPRDSVNIVTNKTLDLLRLHRKLSKNDLKRLRETTTTKILQGRLEKLYKHLVRFYRYQLAWDGMLKPVRRLCDATRHEYDVVKTKICSRRTVCIAMSAFLLALTVLAPVLRHYLELEMITDTEMALLTIGLSLLTVAMAAYTIFLLPPRSSSDKNVPSTEMDAFPEAAPIFQLQDQVGQHLTQGG